MIVELSVENLAIIERATLSFGPGFTVLTGETGAGKSLLIDAIELALGERADTELVRAGATRAAVSLTIDLSSNSALRDTCTELGIMLEDNLLFIQREVFAEGRSQCRVGGRLTPVGGLRQLGALLVDLHGQHDHQSLFDADRHIDFLDEWIGTPLVEPLRAVSSKFSERAESVRSLNDLRSGMREREHRLDLLRFQVNEIESVDPKLEEFEAVSSSLQKARHAEKLAQTVSGALQALAEQEGSAQDVVGDSVRSLEDALRLDSGIESVLTPLQSAYADLGEAIHSLRDYAGSLEIDPEQLEVLEERIESLRKLRRKYGEDEEAVLSFLEQARQSLDLLEEAESNEEALAQRVAALGRELGEACTAITTLRTDGALKFAAGVQEQLRQLDMERAIFQVSLLPVEPTSSGADRVEFFFSANAGEPPRPLSKIASGGEVSRVMLAIKAASSGRAGVPTLIFDEVDAGLGGRAAAVVAKKLEELAVNNQVLVISHLAQIASRAGTHFRI